MALKEAMQVLYESCVLDKSWNNIEEFMDAIYDMSLDFPSVHVYKVLSCFSLSRLFTVFKFYSCQVKKYGNISYAVNYNCTSKMKKTDGDWPPQWAYPEHEEGKVTAPPSGRVWESSRCPACWQEARVRRCAARWRDTVVPGKHGHIEIRHCTERIKKWSCYNAGNKNTLQAARR